MNLQLCNNNIVKWTHILWRYETKGIYNDIDGFFVYIEYYFSMIGYLRGTIIQQDLKSVLLDVGGVGYKVYVHGVHSDAHKEVALFTYLAVRENALDLYGFEK